MKKKLEQLEFDFMKNRRGVNIPLTIVNGALDVGYLVGVSYGFICMLENDATKKVAEALFPFFMIAGVAGLFGIGYGFQKAVDSLSNYMNRLNSSDVT